MIPQPHGSMSTGRSAADHYNIPRDGLAAAVRASLASWASYYPLNQKCGYEAQAHRCLAAKHADQRTPRFVCTVLEGGCLRLLQSRCGVQVIDKEMEHMSGTAMEDHRRF